MRGTNGSDDRGVYITREQFDADGYVRWEEPIYMTLVLVGMVLLLCLLPSLLFLGLWHGLVRMQRGSLLTRASARAGCTDPAVTWSDVIDAYTDPQQPFAPSPSESQSMPVRDEQCSACAAENAPFASYCRHCFRKLE